MELGTTPKIKTCTYTTVFFESLHFTCLHGRTQQVHSSGAVSDHTLRSCIRLCKEMLWAWACPQIQVSMKTDLKPEALILSAQWLMETISVNYLLYRDCKYYQLTIAVPSVKNNILFVIFFQWKIILSHSNKLTENHPLCPCFSF